MPSETSYAGRREKLAQPPDHQHLQGWMKNSKRSGRASPTKDRNRECVQGRIDARITPRSTNNTTVETQKTRKKARGRTTTKPKPPQMETRATPNASRKVNKGHRIKPPPNRASDERHFGKKEIPALHPMNQYPWLFKP
ncbi:unnamed protein product [Linum trigynum]|uniref:Uncharacterized protein n=1 Tax=Linum trigynum TaxID=586398 RepID=A0AAV2EY60_9ROSI